MASVSISVELGLPQTHLPLRLTGIVDLSSLASDLEIFLNIQRNSCFVLCQSYWVHLVFLLLAKSFIIYSWVCKAFLIPPFGLWCRILGFLFDIPKSSPLLSQGYLFKFGLSLLAESGPQQCSSGFLRPSVISLIFAYCLIGVFQVLKPPPMGGGKGGIHIPSAVTVHKPTKLVL